MFDVLVIDDFLSADTLRDIVPEFEHAPGEAAVVYGGRGGVDPRVRRADIVSVSPRVRAEVDEQLRVLKPRLETHFNIPLSGFEKVQFLRYGLGGFFVAHQDGNSALIPDDSRNRRVSVVIFVNDKSAGAYSGGSLVFHGSFPDWDERFVHEAPRAGSLIAFRSETTHEVTPVDSGHRYTIVAWYR